MPDDVFSLAIFDGPYAMQKADWDRLKVSELADWYRPHLEDADRLLADSASLYFWNTAEGWATVHPVILSMGWTFCSLITWVKGQTSRIGDVYGYEHLRMFADLTEVCGFYQREAWSIPSGAGSEIAYAAGADDRNWIRPWLGSEWQAAGLRRKQADEALETNGMAGHYFGASQWSLPTWDAFQRLAEYAQTHGTHRDRPYLVHDSCWPGGGLRASYDHLRAEYDHLRAEYEASRPAFTCPHGVGNVWTHGPVAGNDRLRDDANGTLHPCQKHRDEARRVITAELNQDGVDYIGPALRQMQGMGTRKVDPQQVGLFGGTQ
jgi:site-specific DNA-methyltransferase (adenine-specific)